MIPAVLRKNFIRSLRARSSRPLTAYGMGIRESNRPANKKVPDSQGIDYTSISAGWVFGRKLDLGWVGTADLPVDGRQVSQAARSSWYSWWSPPSTGFRLTVAPSGSWWR